MRGERKISESFPVSPFSFPASRSGDCFTLFAMTLHLLHISRKYYFTLILTSCHVKNFPLWFVEIIYYGLALFAGNVVIVSDEGAKQSPNWEMGNEKWEMGKRISQPSLVSRLSFLTSRMCD